MQFDIQVRDGRVHLSFDGFNFGLSQSLSFEEASVPEKVEACIEELVEAVQERLKEAEDFFKKHLICGAKVDE